MSDRESAINVLLGAILLGAFAVSVLAVAGAIWTVLYTIDLAVKHFLPAVDRPWDIEFYGLICLAILALGVKQSWRRLSTNAFLSFAAAPSILLPWLFNSQPHHAAGLALRFPIAWFIVLLLPRYSRIPLSEFVACASIISASFALNAGLLGSGALSTIVGMVLSVAVIARALIDARDGKYGEPWSVFSPSTT